jgi:hypothetical protein
VTSFLLVIEVQLNARSLAALFDPHTVSVSSYHIAESAAIPASVESSSGVRAGPYAAARDFLCDDLFLTFIHSTR